jgi:hypothetical protein
VIISAGGPRMFPPRQGLHERVGLEWGYIIGVVVVTTSSMMVITLGQVSLKYAATLD